MTKPLAVFDCDDVLCNMRAALYFAMRNRGIDIPVHTWRHYDLQQTFGLSIENCLEIMAADHVLENATAEDGAAEAINALRATGHRVEIWTARSWHPNGQSLTEAWAEREGLFVDQVRVFDFLQSKSAAMNEHTPVRAFIDDSIRHISDAHSNPYVGQAVLMTRPWNESAKNLNRAHTLRGFADMVIAQHSLPISSLRTPSPGAP